MPSITNIGGALNWGKSALLSKEIKDAELSAELLLADVVGVDRISMYSQFDKHLSKDEQKNYEKFINRRLNSEPIQYILGYTYFYGLKIICEKDVLIPRPETEQLVDVIIKENSSLNNANILDLCCGTGCIACAIVKNLANLKALGIDISKKACDLTLMNAKKNNLENNIEVKCMDIRQFSNIKQKFDLIISNPPYVPRNVIDNLDREVKNFEPISALDGGEAGLLYYIDIFEIAKNYLNSKGTLYLEFYEENFHKISDMAKKFGYENIKLFKDFNEKFRFVKIRK